MQPEETNIKRGSVVQISPDHAGRLFAGCMLTVTEVKEWGVQGYVQALGSGREESGGQAYYRVKWADIVYVGEAPWVVGGVSE